MSFNIAVYSYCILRWLYICLHHRRNICWIILRHFIVPHLFNYSQFFLIGTRGNWREPINRIDRGGFDSERHQPNGIQRGGFDRDKGRSYQRNRISESWDEEGINSTNSECCLISNKQFFNYVIVRKSRKYQIFGFWFDPTLELFKICYKCFLSRYQRCQEIRVWGKIVCRFTSVQKTFDVGSWWGCTLHISTL